MIQLDSAVGGDTSQHGGSQESSWRLHLLGSAAGLVGLEVDQFRDLRLIFEGRIGIHFISPSTERATPDDSGDGRIQPFCRAAPLASRVWRRRKRAGVQKNLDERSGHA